MEQHIISRDQFEAQLARAAAQVKDPEVGLFGPDSMMWRLSRHALFGAHGAGRALVALVGRELLGSLPPRERCCLWCRCNGALAAPACYTARGHRLVPSLARSLWTDAAGSLRLLSRGITSHFWVARTR